MAFLRTPTAIKTAVIASALPAAFAQILSANPFSSSSESPNLCSLLSLQILSPRRLSPSKKSVCPAPPSALHMDAPTSDRRPTSQSVAVLPELLTEFMVDMNCEGCVIAVKSKLQTVDGVKNVEVDLSNQVVRILGSAPVKVLTDALEQSGRNARLIGQGIPEDFVISAAVSEFKGPQIFGVVRFAQVNMDLARIEASFSGLCPGKHRWSIHEFSDLTRAASTGKVFNPQLKGVDEPLGNLGTLEADEKGEAFYSGVKPRLRVAELIGLSVVVYGTLDKSDSGISAAVIARSAGVGENYKKLCTCDGKTICESSDGDFVTSKV